MKKFVIICAALTAFYVNAANKSVQSIDVINGTDQAVCVQHTVPAQTHARIIMKLKKLDGANGQLYQAIVEDSDAGVAAAVASGADINGKRNQKSPMLMAVLLRKNSAIAALLKAGAKWQKDGWCDAQYINYSLNLKNAKGAYLLLQDLISRLKDKNTKPFQDQYKSMVLNRAIELEDFDTAKKLLSDKAGVFSIANRSTHMQHQNITTMTYLLRKFAQIDRGESKIPGSLVIKLMQTCFDKGYQINNMQFDAGLHGQGGCAPYHLLKSPECLEMLIDNGWVLSSEDLSCLINHGFIDSLRVALDSGICINDKTCKSDYNQPMTLLERAIEKGNVEAVDLLLEFGANL